jgi:hypothetical protein
MYIFVVLTTMLAAAGGSGNAAEQKQTTADAASRLSGTWKLNRELSPRVTAPGGGGRDGRGAGGASFAVAMFQRGGGGGRGGDMGGGSTQQDLTPAELAGQAALRQMQQIAEVITIGASVDRVTFRDVRGERSYAIDDKAGKLEVGGATLTAKTKWDKLTLRQEFSNPSRKLIQTWDVDESGRLVLKVRLESLTLNTPDVKAIFDRQ